MEQAPRAEEPYTVEETAARLKVEPNWLRKQAAMGRVPSRQLGRRRLFMESDIQKILEDAARGRSIGLTPGSIAAKMRDNERRRGRP